MCNVCTEGIAGHDELGKPIFCTACKEGLNGGMAQLSKKQQEYAETLHGYDIRSLHGDTFTRWEEALRRSVQWAFSQAVRRHDALETKFRAIERQAVIAGARARVAAA